MTKHKLVFATNNRHKIQEVLAMMGSNFKLLSLDDIDCHEDIAETGTAFAENALIKSRFIFDRYTLNCFADDSGVEVEALNNEPGVYSARYAGKHGDAEANMDKLLENMQGVENRKARFRTVISLIWKGEEHFFEGTAEGTIRHERSGATGFGYDPIFQPDGYSVTFSEMPMDEKNRISHRGKAIEKMVAFLNQVS